MDEEQRAAKEEMAYTEEEYTEEEAEPIQEHMYTEALYVIPKNVRPKATGVVKFDRARNGESWKTRFARFIRWLNMPSKSKRNTKTTNPPKLKERDYVAKSSPIGDVADESSSAHLDHVQTITASPADHEQNTAPRNSAQNTAPRDYAQKSAPPNYMSKSAPKRKEAAPSSKPTAIARALEETARAPLPLTSAAFSETRFAKAFETWAEAVSTELKDSAQQVEKDSVNGYRWTLFAKVCKYVEDEDAGENPVFTTITDVYTADKVLPISTPLENGPLSIQHDESLIDTFVFKIHPTFVPHEIKQKAPKISRVGWGSFFCGVEVHIVTSDGQITPVRFDHNLILKEKSVGSVESTYYLEIRNERFIVQVGNTYGLIDSGETDDVILSGIAKSRAKRMERLQRTQERLDEVRRSQRVIDEFIAKSEEKRMALGAVVAAILNGREINAEAFQALYEYGRSTVRCVVLDSDTVPIFERFMLGGTALGAEVDAFDVSRDASQLAIDRFVSHSWFDDAQQKCETILKWAREFEKREKRPARIWCDKFCLKQTSDDLKMSVPCLPIYLLSCERVLLLRTRTFVSRLWCLTEVYTNYVMGMASSEDKGLDVIQLDDSSQQPLLVSVAAARCSFQDDEDALRKNFDRAPGGILEVEKALNLALI